MCSGLPHDPLVGGLLQGTDGNVAHCLVWAGQEIEGVDAHHGITEAAHMGHVGTSLLIRDMQNFIDGLK